VQLARVSVSAADRPLELLINGSLIQGKSGWEGGEPAVRGSGAAAMQILRAAAARPPHSPFHVAYYTHCC
jgi:hypothetical protein